MDFKMMNSDNEERIKWIKKVCWFMESFTLGILGLTALFGLLYVWSLIGNPKEDGELQIGFILLITGVKLKVIYHIKMLFSLYKMGYIFTRDTVKQFKGMGYTLFIAIAVYALKAFSLGLLKGDFDQKGYLVEMIFIGFLTALPYLFFATVVWLASWVMEEAILLKKDADLTI
jgi:hypothetical protein